MKKIKPIIISILIITVLLNVTWFISYKKYGVDTSKLSKDIFHVKIENEKGEYILTPGQAVKYIIIHIQQLYFDDISLLADEQQQELWKAISIVCRTNIVKKWKEQNCPDLLINLKEFDNDIILDEEILNMNNILKALNETEGLVLNYDNDVIYAPFCYLTAGYTRNKGNYLLKIQCDHDMQNNNLVERKKYSFEQFWTIIENLIIRKEYVGYSIQKNIEQIKYERDDSGYVKSMLIPVVKITKENDKIFELSDKSDRTFINIPSKYIKDSFDLHSLHFCIEGCNGDEQITIVTRGKGDGYGLSINQAKYLASQDYSYDSILYFFYNNVKLQREW